ncbi:DNA-processing protein DprA [Shewanella dokdonensis]|uniref:DNA-processing protein DprA n=1 Tax=Shewanella dokdonensis TaxID=712036 RepID=A0ABX8DJ51_9GAMM|nr:DNA-processing protein DprA [Shewanella dokdonensis]MCL1076306.1 DNA-processing protein DprA [Shewanella dokdonensis]QVK24797.1 DNA-processing protein DprA [Shewanella dokdonensis]
MDVSELRQRLEHEPKSLSLTLPVPLTAAVWRKVEMAQLWQQQASHHHLICRADPLYPPLLQQIADPPSILFIKGHPETLLRPSVAIVGSRAASHGGLSLAFQFAAELDSIGLAVVSGMAAGIDGAAHKGALSHSGQTVAVLGTGIEQIYPKRHRQLYEDIQQHGAVISEFWPEVTAFAGNFPKRNRIISGLALGTLVVEARRRSGSLISARTAMEQGREVFAIPGAVLSGDHQGCHDLIKNGAKLVESLADIIEELSPLLQSHLQALPSYVPLQTEHNSQLPFKTLLASVGYETTPLDVVVEQSGITLDLVLEQLLELELQGWVAAVPGGYVRLKRN